eukprot:410447-Pelagomonas_calceolata.AAC.1
MSGGRQRPCARCTQGHTTSIACTAACTKTSSLFSQKRFILFPSQLRHQLLLLLPCPVPQQKALLIDQQTCNRNASSPSLDTMLSSDVPPSNVCARPPATIFKTSPFAEYNS